MRLAEIWRYPVKSMAGERLAAAQLRKDGIEGDRVVQAWDARNRILTARTQPGLLGHRATIGEDGEPRVDGLPWADPEVTRRVEAAAGRGVRLRRFEGRSASTSCRSSSRRTVPSPPLGATPGASAPTS